MKLDRRHEADAASAAGNRAGSRRPIAVRASTALLLLLLVAGCFAGCGGGSSSGGEATGDGDSAGSVLRVGVKNAPSSPNPAKVALQGAGSAIFLSLAYAPLLHATPEGEIQPALAESWRYLDSGGKKNQVFELTLREGAKFADGSPVNAAAVVKWLNYFIKSPNPFNAVLGENPKFTATDSRTVRVTLSGPNPQLPRLLSDAGPNIGFVMSPAAIDNPKLLVKETAGAGPYMLDSQRTVGGDHYTYVLNPNYYGDEVDRYEEVVVRVIAEATSRLQTASAGQLDLTEGDYATDTSAESAGLEVVSEPTEIYFYALDMVYGSAPELKDIRVRKALNLAIDREAISEALFKGGALPTSAFIPADVDAGLEDYWGYDPEKAKQLLKEAGYEDGLTLSAISAGQSGGSAGEPMLRAVAKNLEEVGVKLDITTYPNETEFVEAIFAYESGLTALTAGVATTTENWGIFFAPKAIANFFGDDPQMEKFYDAGLVAADPEDSWRQLYERYTSQAYVLPVAALSLSYYVSDSVGGVSIGKRLGPVATEWFPK